MFKGFAKPGSALKALGLAIAFHVSMASAESPGTTLLTPEAGTTRSGDVRVSGSATAPGGVEHVLFTFRDQAGTRYWNGNAWQSRFIRYPVPVTPAGGRSVDWETTIPASALSDNDYFARAWSRSLDGFGDPVGDAQVTFTWQEIAASLVAPEDGATLTDVALDLEWQGNATFYWITAGDAPGSARYASSGLIRDTNTFQLAGLPDNGEKIFIRLWYWVGGRDGQWRNVDATYTALDTRRTLVFAEEFDQFDSTVWRREHSTYGDGNNELQCYTPEQVSVQNGSLILRAEARTVTCPNGSVRTVTSGMVRSRGITFSPGQFIEYRVKLTPDDATAQGGLWPAFWASGWAGSWPLGGEWDGLEVMTAVDPTRVVSNIHYLNADGNRDQSPGRTFLNERFSDNWHVLGFSYGVNGVLRWYLDGDLIHEVTSAATQQGWPVPFNQPMTELKINLALGGRPGPLQPQALPATYEIDYIRIYDDYAAM